MRVTGQPPSRHSDLVTPVPGANISRPVGSASAVSTARSVRERFIVVVNAPF